MPKRVVIDTNVCLDLFVFRDPRWANLLTELEQGTIVALTHADCRAEWLAVLHYPHLPVNKVNRTQIESRFDGLISCVAPMERTSVLLPICSDKDDQKFLQIARDTDAEVLITKDKALLKLARKMRVLGYFKIQTPEQFILNRSTQSVALTSVN